MPMAEPLGVFFNSKEFSTEAVIRGHTVVGLEGHTAITVSEVETTQTSFTCATRAIWEIAHGEHITLSDRVYRIVGVQPDGTGLTRLMLELLSCTSP